jgi:hypothetical protein
MLRIVTTIFVALAFCALTPIANHAWARGGGGHGGGHGGGGWHGGGGGWPGGGASRAAVFRSSAAGRVSPMTAIHTTAIQTTAIHTTVSGPVSHAAVIHTTVSGIHGRFFPGHIHRRIVVSAPIIVGYPYYYGDAYYLDDPVDDGCVLERRLVQTGYGLRWRRVTVCYN